VRAFAQNRVLVFPDRLNDRRTDVAHGPALPIQDIRSIACRSSRQGFTAFMREKDITELETY